MRVDAAVTQQMVSSAQELQARQGKIAAELSSGVRIQSLSDDPAAVAQAGLLANSLRQTDSFLATAATVQNRMQAADSALGSVVSQLTSAISTAVAATDPTLTPQQQATAAQNLRALRDELLSTANSSYAGTYLFAGTATAGAPFVQAASGAVSYAGDNNREVLGLVSGGSIPASVPGSSVFVNGASSVFSAMDTLIAQLQSGSTMGAGALVGSMRASLDNVLQQRQTLDSSLTALGTETNYQTTEQTNLRANQSSLLGADTVSLATDLSQTSTQRSALLSTIASVEKGSLFDYLH